MTIVYRVHALRRMIERGITREEVEQVVGGGEVIASYPEDVPYSIALLLGWPRGRPLHVVVAYNRRDDETIVITAYRPSPDLWNGLRRRMR